jgi:glycosyltransferase involved in cell wall biosynthesis
VFVAPLQSGAGIKGKVIGALAHGVPTVMSPVAAEGISISQGVDGFVVSKPEEWVEAIAQAYADSRAWSAMSAGSIAVARAQFGFGAGLGKMKAAMSEIGMLSRGAK